MRPASCYGLPGRTLYAVTISGGGRIGFSKNTISVSDGLMAREAIALTRSGQASSDDGGVFLARWWRPFGRQWLAAGTRDRIGDTPTCDVVYLPAG